MPLPEVNGVCDVNVPPATFARRCVRRIRNVLRAHELSRLRKAATGILSSRKPTDTREAETRFNWLQDSFQSVSTTHYAYDPFACMLHGLHTCVFTFTPAFRIRDRQDVLSALATLS